MDEQGSQEVLGRPINRTRNLAIIIGVVVGLVIAAAALILIDPFGWNLFGLGPKDVAAQAMPPDLILYAHLDMMDFDCEELNAVVYAFSDEADQEAECVLDSWIDEVDQSLQEELNLSFKEDIEPWLGRNIGLGMREFTLGTFGDLEQAHVILAVESRDDDAAEAFLKRLLDAWSEDALEPYAEDVYKGVRLFSIQLGNADELPLVFGRSDDVLLFGAGPEIVQAAIDAQGSESLGDDPQYQEITRELAPESLVTFYMDLPRYMDMAAEVAEGFYGMNPEMFSLNSIQTFTSTAGGISLEDVGVQMDIVYRLDAEKLTPEQREVLDQIGQAPTMDAALPETTYLYYAGRRLDLAWQNLRSTLEQTTPSEDIDESMEMFASTIGFNPALDLFPRLDGEWAFVLVPSSSGLLAEELDVSIGFAFLAQSSDIQGLQESLTDLQIPPSEMSFMSLEPADVGNMMLYNLVQSFAGGTVLTFGTGEEHFLLGSSVETLKALFEEGPSLDASARYQRVWNAFPRGTTPVFYFDMEGLLGQIREGLDEFDRESFDEEVGQVLAPIQFLAVGMPPAKGETFKVSMILFITKE